MAKKSNLPSLQSLVFFESAARHLNFTAAAEELGTTQPAVSHRVREIEKNLDITLFNRMHRGVGLTPEGIKLFGAVQEGLSSIRIAVDEIRFQGTRKVLSLATDFGFAAYWLMPRLSRLRNDMPELEIRIMTSQDDFDIRNEPVDFAIKFGDGKWNGCNAEFLFPEVAVPVCSPAFLNKYGPINTPAELSKVPLLHLENPGQARWVNWQDWFNSNHVKKTNRKVDAGFNDYSFVVQAAIASQGVALGWIPLVNEPLKNGQLQTVINQPIKTERGYFLVNSIRKLLTGFQKEFRAWLIEECRQDLENI